MIDKLFYLSRFKHQKYQLLDENMKRIQKFSVLIMFMESMFLMATFIFKEIFPDTQIFNYRLHYYALLLGAAIMLVASIIYKKKKTFYKVFNWMVYISLTLSLMWSVSVTLLDLSFSDSMVVYLTFVFLSSFVFVIKPQISLIIYGLTQVAFVLALRHNPTWFASTVNSSVFVIFAWVISRYHFFQVSERMRRDEIIEEKNLALEKQNIELVQLMMKDHLTGSYNRYSLDDILAKKWMEAYIHQSKISILMIDVDYFKRLNDTFGHLRGDECLVKVAGVLNKIADFHAGYAFRFGGDEFCMVFTGVKYVNTIMDQIDHDIKKIDLDFDYQLELSIGMYEQVPESDDGQWHCIDLADKNLYHVKAKRNRRKTDC